MRRPTMSFSYLPRNPKMVWNDFLRSSATQKTYAKTYAKNIPRFAEGCQPYLGAHSRGIRRLQNPPRPQDCERGEGDTGCIGSMGRGRASARAHACFAMRNPLTVPAIHAPTGNSLGGMNERYAKPASNLKQRCDAPIFGADTLSVHAPGRFVCGICPHSLLFRFGACGLHDGILLKRVAVFARAGLGDFHRQVRREYPACNQPRAESRRPRGD